MPGDLFDLKLRSLRRDRAFRNGPELFLHDRLFADIVERLALIDRRFRSALLIGCPNPQWRQQLAAMVETIAVVDPGTEFAAAAGGSRIIEDEMELPPGGFDLCVAIGTLDTVNDLPGALRAIRSALRPDSLLIGALAGGDTLPCLRVAMRSADEAMGAASPHIHPRIEPSAMAALLHAGGFVQPVIDVDRVAVGYASLADLVRDLRAMAATNILVARSRRPLSRAALAAATSRFDQLRSEGRTVERFEFLHFACWTASDNQAEGPLTPLAQ